MQTLPEELCFFPSGEKVRITVISGWTSITVGIAPEAIIAGVMRRVCRVGLIFVAGGASWSGLGLAVESMVVSYQRYRAGS